MSDLRLASGVHEPRLDKALNDWKVLRLKDFCTFSQGGRLGLTKQDSYRSSGFLAFSAAGQDGFVEVAEFTNTDAVVLSAIGANCGRCFIAHGDWTLLANVQAIIPDKSRADARFLFYRVNRDDYWPRSGSAQPFIKPSDMKSCWVSLPPLAQQGLIADLLGTLDTAIRETEAIIAKLKAVKQGLLHDLLTRGIDANGELRPPQSEAPHLYKQSPLGWIPKEWDCQGLGKVLIGGTRNGLYKPNSYHGTGPLMIQMGCMFGEDSVNYAAATRVRVSPSELQLFGLEVGDLLFARRSLTFEGAGKCAIVRVLPEPATFESSIVRARVDRLRVDPDFAALFLSGSLSSAHRRTLIRQVAVSGVSGEDIRQFLIATPSLDEQREIVMRLSTTQGLIERETSVAHKFGVLKVALMDDLLTGRIRVTPLLKADQQAKAGSA